MIVDARLVEARRQDAEDALVEYAEALRAWNQPDDEHTKITLRAFLERIIAEVMVAR